MRTKMEKMAGRRYRLVKKCMTQIQNAHARALAAGIPDAVAFVIDCEDALGSRFCSLLDGEAVDDDPSIQPPSDEGSPGSVLLRCDGFRFDDAKRAAEQFFPSMPALDAPPPPDQILVVVVWEGVEAYSIPATAPAVRTKSEAVATDTGAGGIASLEREMPESNSRTNLLRA